MREFSQDTIVAPATAAGAAGLAVVRLSGPAALEIGARLFCGQDDLRTSASHRAHYGWAVDASAQRIDEVLALVLRAPRSYTGEDTVEFSCHGSVQVVEELVAAALAAGARLAEPGEFTRRAFQNGRIDLCQAEAVADLVAAHSQAARRGALEQLRGRLSARVHSVRDALLDLLGDLEAGIDFVEEGIEFVAPETATARAARAAADIDALLATARDGEMLRSGVRASLAGAPNVGKSSLFNRLLQSDRSIVTEHPGTTRDVVREMLHVGGLALVLEDTAGLRPTSADPVERLGIERSRKSHAEADIVLHVLDASRPLLPEEREALASLDPEAALVVLNKIDLLEEPERSALERVPQAAAARIAGAEHGAGEHAPPLRCLAVSAATGAGVDAIGTALAELGALRRLALQNDAVVTIGLRHREALLRARGALGEFAADVAAEEPPEILAVSLRVAVTALGEVAGENVTEEILARVFARFCIGK